GLATELTRSDLPLEVRGNAGRCLGEDAVLGRFGRTNVRSNEAIRHHELRVLRAEMHERGDDSFTIRRHQALVRLLANLRRVQADPDLPGVRIGGPEADEFLQVAVAPRLLACHGAVDGNLVPLDVLENAIV